MASQTPSELTIPKVPQTSAALTFLLQLQPSFPLQLQPSLLPDPPYTPTPIFDRQVWSPSSGEFLGSTQFQLRETSTCHNLIVVACGDDSQDLAGSRISRIRAASRRLYMTPNSSSPGGTSSDYFSATVHMQSHVAVSSLPKRNTLLDPPPADTPWTYRVQVLMTDGGQAGPNGIRKAQRDHLTENNLSPDGADPLRLDCSVHWEEGFIQTTSSDSVCYADTWYKSKKLQLPAPAPLADVYL